MNPIRRGVVRASAVLLAVLALAAFAPPRAVADDAASARIRVVTDATGSRLQVNDRDFMIRGMNWDYIPIGQNYAFDLFSQPDDVIVAALDREMGLLKSMGVNAIRQYTGLPPKWVQFIYERYGIWTILNHPCGRYGFTVNGVWHPVTDYSDPVMRNAIKADVAANVARYKGTPGVLMWLLGNENNYGLSWASFEIEALPQGERDAARARFLYSLFGEIIGETHAGAPGIPVAIANGDLQYLDIIAEECKGLDVMGTNVYRGISVGDMFQRVKDKLGVPLMYSEFGCDAFNAITSREDQAMQAKYLIGQWREIYEQSAGHGGVGNAIGACVFQWSDGWWKFGQDSRLDVHDTHASWPDGGYTDDFRQGENNMNEEWWGICAKGPADARGLYDLYPRAAYFALQKVFAFDPYAPGADRAAIATHFAPLDPIAAEVAARGNTAALRASATDRVRVSAMRMQLETISTGGERITTPLSSAPQASFPQFRGFDKLQEFWADVQARPTDQVTGTVQFNVLGNVPVNPINEIFYENRGRLQGDFDNRAIQGIERLKVHHASITWDDRWFLLDGFYRSGHYHWGYEGDFFELYREANYGTNTDVYNADAPVGFEMTGKRQFDGLKMAFGQELWWGANPSILFKYRRDWRGWTGTGIYQEDVASQTSFSSTSQVPALATRKASLALEHARGPFKLQVGGLWSNSNKVGQAFQFVEKRANGYLVKQDWIYDSDALGAKAKLTYQKGRFNWYAQSARMGLVADGGGTQVQTFTGWSLKDVGTGNQTNFISGFTYMTGNWTIGPNFLWQKPIIGPVPADAPSPAHPRDAVNDPFFVRANREMTGAELVLCWDPTPATWLWQWDNEYREDARLAASLDFVYRHMPTTMDAAFYYSADGTRFAFPGATPARDLWEIRARVVSRLSADRRFVGTAFVGDGEPNGNYTRLVHRRGADARLGWGSMAYAASAHWNDWGPYDYHRDFNLTFPLQLSADVSRTLGPVRWFSQPQTAIGVKGIWRSLDEYSPRYSDLLSTGKNGSEWEVRTYLNLAM
ncbi:MAG: glycoside hydrolase family 2 TIM barrel-domain containing protein [Candidatus Eisenbacteria bacterium]